MEIEEVVNNECLLPGRDKGDGTSVNAEIAVENVDQAGNVTLDENDFPAFITQVPNRDGAVDTPDKICSSQLPSGFKSDTLEIKDRYCCSICGNSLEKMLESRRLQHVERCKSRQEKTIEKLNEKLKLWEQVLDCPLCREPLQKGPYRIAHIKRCAKNGTVSAVDLLKLIKTQEQISWMRRTNNLPHTRMPKPTAATLKKKAKPKIIKGLSNALNPALAILEAEKMTAIESKRTTISEYFPTNQNNDNSEAVPCGSRKLAPPSSPGKKIVKKKRKYAEINFDSLPLHTADKSDRRNRDQLRLTAVLFSGKETMKVLPSIPSSVGAVLNEPEATDATNGDLVAKGNRWWQFAGEIPPDLKDLVERPCSSANLAVDLNSMGTSHLDINIPKCAPLETCADVASVIEISSSCNNQLDTGGNDDDNIESANEVDHTTEGEGSELCLGLGSSLASTVPDGGGNKITGSNVSAKNMIGVFSEVEFTRIQTIPSCLKNNKRLDMNLRKSGKIIGKLLGDCADSSIGKRGDLRPPIEVGATLLPNAGDCGTLVLGPTSACGTNITTEIESSDLSRLVNDVIAQHNTGKRTDGVPNDMENGADNGVANRGSEDCCGDSEKILPVSHIACSLDVGGGPIAEFDTPSTPWQFRGLLGDLCALFDQRMETGDVSVTFASGEPGTKVHGLVLQLRCPELWKQIESNALCLSEEITGQLFSSLLRYLYYADVNFCMEEVTSLTKIAKHFRLDCLYDFLNSLRMKSPPKKLSTSTKSPLIPSTVNVQVDADLVENIPPEKLVADGTEKTSNFPLANDKSNYVQVVPDQESDRVGIDDSVIIIDDERPADSDATQLLQSGVQIGKMFGNQKDVVVICGEDLYDHDVSRSKLMAVKSVEFVNENLCGSGGSIDLTLHIANQQDDFTSEMPAALKRTDYEENYYNIYATHDEECINLSDNSIVLQDITLGNKPTEANDRLASESAGKTIKCVDLSCVVDEADDLRNESLREGSRLNRSCTPLLFEEDEEEAPVDFDLSPLCNPVNCGKSSLSAGSCRFESKDYAIENQTRKVHSHNGNSESPVIQPISSRKCLRNSKEFSLRSNYEDRVFLADSPGSDELGRGEQPVVENCNLPAKTTSTSTPLACFAGTNEANGAVTDIIHGATPGFSVIKRARHSAFRPVRSGLLKPSPELHKPVDSAANKNCSNDCASVSGGCAVSVDQPGSSLNPGVSAMAAKQADDYRKSVNDSDSSMWNEIVGMASCRERNEVSSKPSSSDTPLTLLRNQGYQIIKTANVTPLPDYSLMETPQLRAALSKYGLKPLAKRKAKLALRQIYQDTHPVLSGDMENISVIPTKISSKIAAMKALKSKKTDKIKRTKVSNNEKAKKDVAIEVLDRIMADDVNAEEPTRAPNGTGPLKLATTTNVGNPSISTCYEESGDTPLSVRLRRRLGDNHPCSLIGQLRNSNNSASQPKSVEVGQTEDGSRKLLSQLDKRKCDSDSAEFVPRKRCELDGSNNYDLNRHASNCKDGASHNQDVHCSTKAPPCVVPKNPFPSSPRGQHPSRKRVGGSVLGGDQDGSCSSSDTDECLEESAIFEAIAEPSCGERQDTRDSRSLDEVLTSLFTSDKVLYERILMFEAVHLNEFIERVKTAGITSRKCGKNALMDYLDKHCIAFTMKEKGKKFHQPKRR